MGRCVIVQTEFNSRVAGGIILEKGGVTPFAFHVGGVVPALTSRGVIRSIVTMRWLTARSLPLAQESGMGSVFFWALMLIGFLVAMFVVVTLIRRSLRDDDAPTTGPGFTLGDLRDLHARGQMTDEEFAKAKDVLVRATKKAAERPASTSDNPATRPRGVPPGPPIP